MKGPERLLESDASPFEAELLRSWHVEQPNDRVRQRVLAMGAGAATVVAASASAEAAGAVGSKLGAGLVIKWFGAGVVAGLATSAVTVSALAPPAPQPPERAEVHAAAPVVRTSLPVAPRPLGPAVDTSAPAPALHASPTGGAPRREAASFLSAPAPEEAPRPPSLGALAPQVALLDRARNELRAGNSARALQLVAEYHRTYPHGVLSQEAEVLGIDILERQGQRGEAKRRARRFLDSHPTSAHADRLRRLAGEGSNP